MGKQSNKQLARNTLFIDQIDASYWLAADCLLDEEERKRRTSRAGLGLDLNGSDFRDSEKFGGESNVSVKSRPGATKTISAVTAAAAAAADGGYGSMEDNVVKAPTKRISRPFSRQLPPLPLNIPDRPIPKSAPFLSPRAAPPAPKFVTMQKTLSPTKPPTSPLPPIPNKGNDMHLQPPIHLRSDNQTPSPNASHHPGSSLIHQPSAFSYLVNHTSSIYSDSTDSCSTPVMPLSPISSPSLGVVIISSFPPPPQRIKVEAVRPQKLHHVVQAGQSEAKGESAPQTLKPLPPTPGQVTNAVGMNEDGFRRAGELHAWSVGFDTAGCPRILPMPSAFHHPECRFASHAEIQTEQCGCRSNMSTSHRLKPSNSAPDLLEMGRQHSQTQLDDQRIEMQQLKREVYRISDEVKKYATIQQTNKTAIPDRVSSQVKSRQVVEQRRRVPESAKSMQSPQRQRHIRLAEPGERPPVHMPSGPILLPPSQSQVSSLDLATSNPAGLRGMPLHSSPSSPLNACGGGSSGGGDGSPTANGNNRMRISTVRSHNRDAPSPVRMTRSSPPLPSTPIYHRIPTVKMANPTHHRQTSSKSSNYSSDSDPSSGYSTGATSVESLA